MLKNFISIFVHSKVIVMFKQSNHFESHCILLTVNVKKNKVGLEFSEEVNG